jgi:catechol 2,3-dioxygenase-like lactoylglutathione lyase family enzyme
MLHHVELWVPDLRGAVGPWGWLLGELGWEQFQDWPAGRSWRYGDVYLVLEQSPALTGGVHDRTAPGLNHLAFTVGGRRASSAQEAATSRPAASAQAEGQAEDQAEGQAEGQAEDQAEGREAGRDQGRDEVDRLTAAAPEHGWSLMFADRHPHAGGPDTYAAYLEDNWGYEVEIQSSPPTP